MKPSATRLVGHADRIRELAESSLHLVLPEGPQLAQLVRNLEAIKRNAEILKAELRSAAR